MEMAGARGQQEPPGQGPGSAGLAVGSGTLWPHLCHHSPVWQGEDAETLWTTRGFCADTWTQHSRGSAGSKVPTTKTCPRVFQARVASLPHALVSRWGWATALALMSHGVIGAPSLQVPCCASVSPYVTWGCPWGLGTRGKLISSHGALHGSDPPGPCPCTKSHQSP